MSQNASDAFTYIFHVFSNLSRAKIREVIFTGPDIRKFLKDDEFKKRMNDKERVAWLSFREVIKKFLGNYKDPEYKNIVANMMCNFKELGCL